MYRASASLLNSQTTNYVGANWLALTEQTRNCVQFQAMRLIHYKMVELVSAQ